MRFCTLIVAIDPVETRFRGFQKVLPKRGRDEFLHGLIVESADGKLAWDSVKQIAEHLLRGEEPLPAELRKWIAKNICT